MTLIVLFFSLYVERTLYLTLQTVFGLSNHFLFHITASKVGIVKIKVRIRVFFVI